MAKTVEKTTLAGIVVGVTIESGKPEHAWRATFRSEHEQQLRLALYDRLQTAGYAVYDDQPTLHVRRTNNATPKVYVKLNRVYSESYSRQSDLNYSISVATDSWGTGGRKGRRFPLDVKVDKRGAAWTFTFSVNWQAFLGAVEERLSVAEGDHAHEVARANEQQAKADAVIDLFEPVSRLKLHENVGRSTLVANTSTSGYTIELDMAGAITGAVLAPYARLFPDAHVEIRFGEVRLTYLSIEDIKKGLTRP